MKVITKKKRSAAAFLLVVMFVLSCSKADRIRQVRTFSDMQTITGEIEALREREPGALGNPSRIRRLISATGRGRDAWNHEYLFLTRTTRTGFSYVLVSMGSDGKSDVADRSDYFSMSDDIIHGRPWRDIVFRDGHPITRAGK
jgi:hypothetical protein